MDTRIEKMNLEMVMLFMYHLEDGPTPVRMVSGTQLLSMIALINVEHVTCRTQK